MATSKTIALKRNLAAVLFAATALVVGSPVATAGGDAAILAADGPVYTGRAVGCYYHRGRRFCSRYCYIEVNGLEYCHDRQSEAFPQGIVFEDAFADDHPEPSRWRRYK